MTATEWTALVMGCIGAISSLILQMLHMWLSYKRDMAAKENLAIVKADVQQVAKATNGLTEKIVTAEVTAERVVAKAEIAAHNLLVTAAAAAAAAAEKKT